MSPTTPRGPLRRPSGLRAGIVIGLAFALVGVGVGTATGAVTPFQQVVVVNTPAQALPVTGTVTIGSAPANQSVAVSNFPATQAIAGSVSVDTVADESYYEFFIIGNGDSHTFNFGRTIKVTSLTVSNFSDDDMISSLHPVGGSSVVLHDGAGFSRDFTYPVPATSVGITCLNDILDCHVSVGVFGTPAD